MKGQIPNQPEPWPNLLSIPKKPGFRKLGNLGVTVAFWSIEMAFLN
jgi:hypothetical protein